MTMEVVAPVSAFDGVRLSPQQRRLWLLQEQHALPCARALVQIEGALDPERLRRALSKVIARHEILRTTYRRDVRLYFPLQVVAPYATPVWRSVDIGELVAEKQKSALESLWHQAAWRSFDVERGPVLEIDLVRRGRQEHYLLLTLSALCADTWTLRSLVRELAESYAAETDPALFPDQGAEPVQYAQFAEWQNDLLIEEEMRPLRDVAPIVLPFERKPADEGSSPDLFELELDGALVAGLESLARGTGASLAAALFAIWQVHLARLGGRRDFAVWVLCAGRRLDEVQEVMGPVAKWSRVTCLAEDALDLAALVRDAQAGLEDAEEDPCETGSPTGNDGIHDGVGFAFEDIPEPTLASGLAWRIERLCGGTGGGKLALLVARHSRGIRMRFSYDRRRISGKGVAALAEQQLALLQQAAQSSSAPIRRLSLLGPVERARRLSAVRAVACDAADLRALHQSFELQVKERPDSLAVVCGQEQLNYRELNERANQLAHCLRRRGVRRGNPVGLCGERSAGMIVGMLGILKAHAAYVPLDPLAPVQRLRQQFQNAGFQVVVTDDRVRGGLPTGDWAVISLDDAAALASEPVTNPDSAVLLDELASVVFTSGSTGVPKGVAITHRGIASYTRSLYDVLALNPGRHFATVSTLSADLGNTSIFASLATGGCLHVIGYETATDGRLFAEYCRRWPIDVLKIVPSHLGALLDTGEAAALLPRRRLVLGGEALPLALIDRIDGLVGDPGDSFGVFNHYGPTETTVGSLVLPLAAFEDRRGCASVPIGRPLGNADAYVLDERLEPASTGTVGELYLGGTGLARGYLGRPDLTAERFLPHPFADGARLYRTGDRARYRPDGTIEFMGRRDYQIKIRGFRIELGEIEARLREHPSVNAVVVTVREDGASGPCIVAYVVPHEESFDEAAVREFLGDRLPEYMLPSDFVLLRALPLTSNGKLDRRALPNPAGRRRREHVPPRTPTEESIARIWSEVLRVPCVGVEDDFFELGGHSLLAIPLIYRIQKALGGSLSLAAIFQAPTVSGLARLIGAGGSVSSVVPLRAAGSRLPLVCVDPTGHHVNAYRPLADACLEDQPVFGLDLGPALATAGEDVSIRSVTERLVRELREHQPRGPYHLLGWSLGGVLAVGIACVLEEQQESVAFLGTLDTNPRTRLYETGEPDIVEELAGYIDPDRRAGLLALPGPDLKSLRDRVQGLGDDDRVAETIAWAQARRFLSDAVPKTAYRHRYALLRDAARFVSELPPRSLVAPMHVWWSADTLARHGGPPLDWQSYTSGRVNVEVVSGDHLSAVQSPEVHRRVRSILEELDSNR